MSMIITGAIILGALVWLVGSYTTLMDLLDRGKSLEDYREKYGHDLGMLVCCTYRGLMIFAWPIMGIFGFTTGLIRDIIKITLHGSK